MSESTTQALPRVWTWKEENGGQFATINRPYAGARHEAELPVGAHDFQLYSLATPNGVKVNILFEELLEAGFSQAEYDAWPIRIGDGEQFSSGYVAVNPNSKIPVLVDHGAPSAPRRVFESGSILLYLAEKFGTFLPTDTDGRTETMNWLFWQMGSAPYLGGGFGHFYQYAPVTIPYAVDRFAMEAKRQLDVLDRRLAESTWLAGEEYTIADVAVWPWYGALALGYVYDAAEFLQADQYQHLQRWARQIDERPAVKRGRMVNRLSDDHGPCLPERHSSEDFKHLS